MNAVLGINAVFHDPAAALVVDGEIVAAAEEERFTRRKHGKSAVPFATWELPEQAARWCLAHAGIEPRDLRAVAYAYDPALARSVANWTPVGTVIEDGWERLRTLYAQRAPLFLRTALPGLDPARVRFVPHHVAHAASAYLACPWDAATVLVVDGRGEIASHLGGAVEKGLLEIASSQKLPHSLGLFYEAATAHLGFQRASDEYKVMALAAYGRPRMADALRKSVRAVPLGFEVDAIRWDALAPERAPGAPVEEVHADLAASVQLRLEEVLLDIARDLFAHTRIPRLAMAGGVALNCVANARLAAEGPFREVFVQPAAGDAGTALGAALFLARALGQSIRPMTTAALGPAWRDEEIEAWLQAQRIAYQRPAALADAAADALAAGRIVGWFQGRSEFGPRALGHRSLLGDARQPEMTERLNAVKGREEFRPVAPLVLAERAAEIFEGKHPSPYMLFTHRVRPAWRARIPAAAHVDGSARVQTVDAADEPELAALLRAFEARTGTPVLINTSFNTGGRPMVDSPRDAVECFATSAIDALVLGPFLLERAAA
ncbi:MAG: carbamoyltransferase [Proteobacteria bacterium]|nr:MAG: carbamoyltransferase [Pseudomonadota bacterium]